ncbi:Ribosome biogenesis protein YTM1 [Fasciolopsis buskii]|uniref:Protein KTI12 homolog n=1 Tax=Fasciolopsis buskii TaxID=27845 RepID=A0A8E0VP39_9TREM|nr:Ribosome biogenesis protein YTM1 [Fasciolopsis buski]
MPLIVVCGYPCSGKSSVVAALVRSLQSLGFLQDLVVLPEPITVTSSGEDPRANVYADSTKERELRGQHKSEVERILSGGSQSNVASTNPRRSVVIMDACNYIKGYRYELYCLAKSLKHPHAVLFCDASRESVMQWNAKIQRYSSDLLLDMIARFEAPQASQRWDSPLFTVKPDLWSSMEEINVDCMASELKQTVLSDNVPSVRANRSTQLVQVAPTDFLQELERITQSVVDHILQAQALGAQSVGLPSSIRSSRGDSPKLSLINRPVKYNLPELTRLKRRYITLQRNSIADPTTSCALPDSFVIAEGFMNFIACSESVMT